MPPFGRIEFEITARRGTSVRRFTIETIDIDDAAVIAVGKVADDETVVQVRELSFDEAAHHFDGEHAYEIRVAGNTAEADSYAAAALALHTLENER